MDAAAADLLTPAILSPLRWHLITMLSAFDAARLACTCRTLPTFVLSDLEAWRATAQAALHQSHPALSSSTVLPLLAALGAHELRQRNLEAGTCRVADINGVAAPSLQAPSGRYLAHKTTAGIEVRACSSDLAAVASLPLLQPLPESSDASIQGHTRWSGAGDCLRVLTSISRSALALVEWEPSHQVPAWVSRCPFDSARLYTMLRRGPSNLSCHGSYLAYFIRQADDDYVFLVDKLFPTWHNVFMLGVLMANPQGFALWHSTKEGLLAAFGWVGPNRSLKVWDLEAGRSSTLSAEAHPGLDMMGIWAWDASGEHLALVDFETRRKVCVVQVDTGRQALMVSTEHPNIFEVQAHFSNLGLLAINWQGGNLEVWDVPQGECNYTLEPKPSVTFPSMAWSHCGSLLAVAEEHQDARAIMVYGIGSKGALLRTASAVAGENICHVAIQGWSQADTSFVIAKHFYASSTYWDELQVVKLAGDGLLACLACLSGFQHVASGPARPVV